jgi:hypothetical protein
MAYSPILAVATAAFELLVAGWALRGAGDRSILRTTAAILVLLAGYQITEVAICANLGAAGFLPRLAFIDVTWLPALGWVVIGQVRRPRSAGLRGAGLSLLAAATGIVVWIVLDRSFASASVCSAVYARYTNAMPRFLAYSIYYWVGLFGMAALSAYGMRTCEDPHRQRMLRQILVGTLGFVLPSVALSWFVPTTAGALPSIMCHFALILAVFLARMVWIERHEDAEASAEPISQAA